MRNRWLFTFSLLVILSATTVFCQIIDKDVAQAMQAFEQLDYQASKTLAEKILQSWQNYNVNELVEIHKILGVIHYTDGNVNEARSQFERALSLNTNAELDSVLISPKIISFYNEVKSQFSSTNSKPSEIRYVLIRDTRPAATVRSFFLPGWGQLYKGQKKKGCFLATATGLSLLTWGTLYVMQEKAHDDYLNAAIPSVIDEKYDRYNRLYKAQQISAIVTGFFWCYAVTDALLCPPPEKPSTLSIVPSVSINTVYLTATLHF